MGAIRYISPLTGGLPRQCSHWLAMTAFFRVRTRKQQLIFLNSNPLKRRKRSEARASDRPCFSASSLSSRATASSWALALSKPAAVSMIRRKACRFPAVCSRSAGSAGSWAWASLRLIMNCIRASSSSIGVPGRSAAVKEYDDVLSRRSWPYPPSDTRRSWRGRQKLPPPAPVPGNAS